MTRRLAAVALGLLVSGCLARQEVSRAETWLVYVREVPLARVTLTGGAPGNVVNVEVEGGTAEVTLGHRGSVHLEPVPASPGLRVKLHQFDVRALALERYADVVQALEEASWAGRDDLAEAVLRATSDEEIARALGRRDGRWALARLYDEVTSGSVSGEEREQAQRVLSGWAQAIGLERFGRAVEDERTRVFPVRKSGPTVLSPVSPMVRTDPDGLAVSLSSKMYEYPEGRALGGMQVRIGYDDVVGVKLYDAGGAVRYVPALFLVEVSNAEGRHVLQKCGELFAFGFTTGLGSGAGAGAGALAWCDRAAVGIGLVLAVVDDHRGWILERYGAEGERFLRSADGLSSLVAFYGLGRVAVALPRAVQGLRNAYLELKASKAALSAEEQALLGRIGRGVDDLVEQAENVIPIERARKPSPAPVVEEQPLRATGTDVRLVPVGQQSSGANVVASAGGGKPTKPLSPAAPSFQGTPTARAPAVRFPNGASRGFGDLSRAAEFGIKPYAKMRQALEGTGLQAHHLIEVRFEHHFKGSARYGLSVAVTPAEHQVFTNLWRARIPYGVNGTNIAKEERILQVAREVYAKYPAILRALGL